MMKETPSLILFYMEDDPLSEKLRANFAEAAPQLKRFGLKFGEFDCLNAPQKCKSAQIQDIPDLRFIGFVVYS